jgi:hypothetical protein
LWLSWISVGFLIPAGLLFTVIAIGNVMGAVRDTKRWRAAETTTGWIVEKRDRVRQERIPKPGMMTRPGVPGQYRDVTRVHARVAYRTRDGRESTFWLDTGPRPGKTYEGGRVPVRYEDGGHGPRVVGNPRDQLVISLSLLAMGLGGVATGIILIIIALTG